MNVTLFSDFIEDKRTSMEVYADNLIQHLSCCPGNELMIREYRPTLNTLVSFLPHKGNLRMRTARYVDYPSQVKYVQGTINHILDHGYAHLLRVLDPGRTIITVHDIIPVLAGQGKIPGVDMQHRSWLSEYSAAFLKKAAQLIAVSQNTKNDLVRHCGCDPEKITVIYLGVHPGFRPFSGEEQRLCRHNLHLPGKETRLILITGAQFYKNQRTSLQVFEKLQDLNRSPVKLLRLGRRTGEWDARLQKSRFREHIIHLEYLSPGDMVCLYNAVDCLLFPSWYEGFGCPPVEAMACGTPVVVSDRASLPEVVGDAALSCAPDDVDGLARAVAKIFYEQDFREELIQKGYMHVQRFNWQENAQKTAVVYKKIVAGKT